MALSSELQPQRMYLKRLDIQGFKTFAGHTVFTFRPGITAIVGPNGSGKSNIADAVRWVLGEQSYAALRCKRTEELLFSGGGRRPPAGLAEVSLTIDNSDRLLPLAFDEVTITRRATRAGENEYFINRAKVRLRDIQAAIEPLGGSYTIINQGLVDLALTLRPEERRRLFEDAAEIGSFEVRKAEAERRLRETDANMQRVRDLLGELEPRLRSLKRQATQARHHRELSDELQALQTRYYTAQWHTSAAALTLAEETATRLAAELEQARTAQHNASLELHALREALRAQRERLSALHQQSSALHTRAEAAQRDLAIAGERLAAMAHRYEELERTQHDLALRAAEVERERESAAALLRAAEDTLAEQQAHLAAGESQVAAHQADRRALAHALSEAQDAALKAATTVAEQRSRLEQLAARRARLAQEQAELDAALQQAHARLAEAHQRAETLRTAAAAAEAEQAAAARAETTARAQLDDLRNRRSAADESLATTRRALADLEARLESLTRLARSYTGTFAGVKAAMQWAERSGRSGFALVASIIRTPAELETAIEVALGSRLQHIVVETWQDAEDAIAELKRSGAGRATFLPLDTLQSRPTSDARRPAGADVLGVAAELVGYDERYQAVVQHLLGRVLVVRDLVTARRELRHVPGGWMLVTLSGEQIHSGGAVTGGAQTKEAGTLRRERELREVPVQIAAVRADVAQVEAQRRALDEQIAAATQAVRDTETRQREAARRAQAQQADLDTAVRQAAHAEQELRWQQERRETIRHDLEALIGQEAQLATEQTHAAQHAAAVQAHLETLRAQQEQAAHADQETQARLSALRAAVAQAAGQARAQHAIVTTHQQSLERIAREQASVSQRLAALAAERAQIAGNRDNAAAAHQALLAEIDSLRAQIDPTEAHLRAQEVHQTELEQRESQLTAALLEQEAACNRAALEAQRARDRLEHLHERATAAGVELTMGDRPQTTDQAQSSGEELQAQIEQLKTRIERLGSVNPLALEEYEQAAERHNFLSTQLDDLTRARATLHELIAELDTAMHARFTHTFSAVAREFERSFTQLFGGGTAKLQLVSNSAASPTNGADPQDATQSSHFGIEIIARPPGKRQQNLSLLSGGERALTASALLFAILAVNPSPFCILDEVDAALDESNVGRFREALADLTRQTQFILITHNRGTIEAADTLYGVTMGEDSASRVLSLRVEDVKVE